MFKDKEIIEVVEKYRIENGFSKSKMANAVGISPSYYGKIIKEGSMNDNFAFKYFFRNLMEEKQRNINNDKYSLKLDNSQLSDLITVCGKILDNKSSLSFHYNFEETISCSENDSVVLNYIKSYGVKITDFRYYYNHKFDAADSYSEVEMTFTFDKNAINKIAEVMEVIKNS